LVGIVPLAGRGDDRCERAQDHDRADEGGEIGADIGYADLAEDGSESGKGR
jgi:hypothetical protein